MMKKILIMLINIYQRIISPLLPKSCRFYPTCSAYSKEAILKYGVFRGCLLSIKRIVRCHPFNKGGYDPVE
nr:membrane protein insertion efficiency factor YidD [Iocasia fonsfrigidae]